MAYAAVYPKEEAIWSSSLNKYHTGVQREQIPSFHRGEYILKSRDRHLEIIIFKRNIYTPIRTLYQPTCKPLCGDASRLLIKNRKPKDDVLKRVKHRVDRLEDYGLCSHEGWTWHIPLHGLGYHIVEAVVLRVRSLWRHNRDYGWVPLFCMQIILGRSRSQRIWWPVEKVRSVPAPLAASDWSVVIISTLPFSLTGSRGRVS